MTPTTVGWILADGHDVDGAALAGAEFTVEPRCEGVGAVNASEQAAATVQRVQTMVEARGERLHGIGVTWSEDAAVEAALLLESLTDAGFDNVVPVRLDQAAESSSGGTGEAEPQLTLAHGAALALEPSRELRVVSVDAQAEDLPTPEHSIGRDRSRTLSYAGALTMLVAGSVGFVVSLSIALSLQLSPAKDARPTHQVAEAPAPRVVQTAPPAAAPAAPPAVAAPETPPEAPAVAIPASAPAGGEDLPGPGGQ